VSHKEKKEEVKIIFYEPEYFKDRKGALVIGGPNGSVPTYLLPP
jgi:hypothetical protein